MNAELQYIDVNGITLCYWQWGEPHAGKPVALLLHGTAFCGATWRPVAEALAADHVVYALDRRGHGRSTAPCTGYQFLDFANDLVAFVDSLNLRQIYGIGHSAGGTDVLLAAVQRPAAFDRLFVMEPTMTDIANRRNPNAQFLGGGREMRRKPRRAEFDSKDEVFERYSASPLLGLWREAVLWDYIEHGFEPLPNGAVRLRCDPSVEMQMLGPIGQAMMNAYAGAGGPDPFTSIRHITQPTMVTYSQHSGKIYHVMANRAVRAIPRAKLYQFRDTNHCVPQENPEGLLKALRAFTGSA